jgi:hypothetical protein
MGMLQRPYDVRADAYRRQTRLPLEVGSIEPVRRTTGRFIQAVRLAAGSARE